MNLQTTFEPAELADVQALRREHLDGLEHAQVLLVELMVRDAQPYLIRDGGGAVCGHFAVHGGDTLIELHLRPEYWVFGTLVVAQVLHRSPVTRALVKSFDPLLFSSCLPYQRGMRTLGWLSRDFVARAQPETASALRRRVATLDDLRRIGAVEQDVFTDAARLRTVVECGLAHLFEKADMLVGFGIVRPIVEGRPDVELGIAVDRPFRRHGHAGEMMRGMIEAARAEGLNPVASCAADNLGSARMGARLGFVARHALLELRLARPEVLRPLYADPAESESAPGDSL